MAAVQDEQQQCQDRSILHIGRSFAFFGVYFPQALAKKGNKVNIGRQRRLFNTTYRLCTTQGSIVLVVSPLKAHKYLQKLTLYKCLLVVRIHLDRDAERVLHPQSDRCMHMVYGDTDYPRIT